MEPTDQYNFSIFRPRNLHGKKNRNVILSMLLIWAVAVFGFQFLLKGIQRPTPEKTLLMFESVWPAVKEGNVSAVDSKTFINSLVLVKGKNTVKPEDQKVLSDAISCVTFQTVPDSLNKIIMNGIADLDSLKASITRVKDQEYLDVKKMISEKSKILIDLCKPFSGFEAGSLESVIFISSLVDKYPQSFDDSSFAGLPEIMKLYLTHNQSVLTDTKFLGFPFHYFYTAVFLLFLFVILCIVYNILIDWRLRKEGIIES
jgi:uncharacterized membrane protein